MFILFGTALAEAHMTGGIFLLYYNEDVIPSVDQMSAKFFN